MHHECKILVTSTFVAHSVLETLSFWVKELDLRCTVGSTPFGQIFQQLLDPTTATSTNTDGFNVLLVRLEDFGRPEDLAAAVGELSTALCSAVARSSAEFILCVCPPSALLLRDESSATRLTTLEAELAGVGRGLNNVSIVLPQELIARHPPEPYGDPDAADNPLVPYSELFCVTIATAISRRVYQRLTRPRKVLVFDCDNTLWKGICGEDGPDGVVLDPPHEALQRFAVARHESGMLLCLCSRNNASDVWAVFARWPEWPLQREHLAGSRINWDDKPANLRSLATELNVALDSFVFVDDDPVVCAAVEASCPEVLTLLLPSDATTIPAFLDAVWALDSSAVTREDRERTTLYGHERLRDEARSQSATFAEFLARLQLEVLISPMSPGHVGRVAQLTNRTNQFNTTTVRRSETEVAALVARSLECLVVHVKDRFGDYGLVGAMIFTSAAGALQVASLMLSCRALGRGVEHRMLAKLGALAQERALERVEVRFVPSGKNQPAAAFLEASGARPRALEVGCTHELSAAHAAASAYRVDQLGDARLAKAAPEVAPGAATEAPDGTSWSRIASRYYDSTRILAALKAAKRRRRAALIKHAAVPPHSAVEEALVAIWTEVLLVDEVGVDDDFFELGGDSLKLTRVSSRVHARFAVELPAHAVFQRPTVEGMAASIAEAQAWALSVLDEIDAYSEQEAVALASEVAEAKASLGASPVGPAPEPASAHITSLAILTGDREDSLVRAFTSYTENNKRYAREATVVVMDQSRTAPARAETRERLRALGKRFDLRVAYAGVEEKERFAESLEGSTGVSAATIRFALFGELHGDGFGWASRAGAQRNGILLQTVGEKLLSVDDDTECGQFAAPAVEHRPRLIVSREPSDVWFFEDLAQARAFAKPVHQDVLAGHERMLGLSPPSADPEPNATAAPWPNASDTPLRDRLDRKDAKVMATFNGLLGDCAWGSPFGYWGAPLGSLMVEDDSHDRLVRSKEAYLAALGTRTILRVARAPSVSDAYSTTTFFGLDNRDLLPPFLPVQRGQDLIFGRMLWRCLEHACFGHLPTALLHLPVEPRRFSSAEVIRSAAGYDLAKLIVDCILECPLKRGEGNGRDRLCALGEHLSELGALPGREFDRRVRVQAERTTSAFAGWMIAHLEARDGLPAFWANDVRRYVEALRVAVAGEHYCIPLDLLAGSTLQRARATAQRVVLEFGRLCSAWPALVEGSRHLRARSCGLARVL